MTALFRCILIGALLGGCVGRDIQSFTNEGAVCIRGDQVIVDMIDVVCLSSSCDSVIESGCTAVIDDGVLQVMTTLQVEYTQPGECTDDCFPVRFQCPLPSGEYDTLTLGAERVDEQCIR